MPLKPELVLDPGGRYTSLFMIRVYINWIPTCLSFVAGFFRLDTSDLLGAGAGNSIIRSDFVFEELLLILFEVER
jgi:hypothetical protein